jgi:exopolysaccharide biosynthesis polyprenyl glycosylphosphotransferase
MVFSFDTAGPQVRDAIRPPAAATVAPIRTPDHPTPDRPTPEQVRSVVRTYRSFVLLGDLLIAAMAVSLAVVVRFADSPIRWYAVVPLVYPITWVAVLALNRTYEKRFIGSGSEEVERILHSGLTLFVSIAVLSFATVGEVSRSIVLVSVPSTVLGSVITRRIARAWLHRTRSIGRGMQRTLVVGRGEAALHLVELLNDTPDHGLIPVGVCLSAGSPMVSTLGGVPVAGATEDVVAAVDRLGVDVVAIVSHPEMYGHPLRQLSWALEERSVELLVSPGIIEVAGPRLSIRPVAGMSLLHLHRPAIGLGAAIAKSVFDRCIASLAIVLLAPLFIILIAVIRLTSSGPALFRQTRTGVDGKEFSIYKFRSMFEHAELRLIDLHDLNEGNGVLFKMRADPRITRVGTILRRFSLDELPQLINVIKGDMSLVGPRPPLPSEVAGYAPDAARRLRVRPGMTGLWQVSGRSDLSWEESLRLDLRYVDNWSMALDISILWRTVRAVLKGAGAY